MEYLEVSAHMSVRPGCLDGFLRQAAECVRITKEQARTKLFKDYADGHFMTFDGEPSPALLDLLKAHQVGFKWFSFVRGLEATPVATA